MVLKVKHMLLAAHSKVFSSFLVRKLNFGGHVTQCRRSKKLEDKSHHPVNKNRNVEKTCVLSTQVKCWATSETTYFRAFY